MRKILEGSVLFRALTAAARWIDGQWRKSNLSRPFTPKPEARTAGPGLTERVGHGLHMALCRVFEALRLDKLLEGSVTRRTFLWAALAVFIAPIFQTMAVLALAVLSLGSLIVVYGCERERELCRSPLTKWLAGFAVVELASTFLSVTFSGSLQGGLLTAVFTLFPIVIIDTCRERGRLCRLIDLMVAAGAIVALYGIAQAALGITSTESWVDQDSFSEITLRVYATLGNPNVLSEYLLLIIPIAAAGIYTAKTPNGKLLNAICAGAMLLCLMLTWSRGGWLGLALGAAVFLVLMDRRFIVLGVIGLAALLLMLPESIMTRLMSIGDMGDSSTSYRVYIWLASLNMLKDYWMCGFGTGVAAFQSVYPRYSFNTVSAPHSHNLFLEIFCENGIMGIVTLLGVFCSLALMLGRSLTAAVDKKTRVLAGALTASLVGFAVQSMVDYSFYNYRVMFVFWAFAGVTAAFYNIVMREAKR